MDTEDKRVLRARDFWTAWVLMGLAVFFLAKTAEIPFFNTANAGVRSAQWFNSAALVPYGLFACLFLCAVGLLVVSVREGGAAHALSQAGLGIDRAEITRIGAIGLILLAYIAGLVPRVDFIIASALVLTALFWGFHRGDGRARWLAVALIAAPALYAFVAHRPQAEWRAPEDDWVALGFWVLMTGAMLRDGRHWPAGRRLPRIVAALAILAPLCLIMAMAFGFRQNVPARAGVVFSKIEVSYYTQFRPWWQSLTGETP